MNATEAVTQQGEFTEASVLGVKRDGTVLTRWAAIQEEQLVDFHVNGKLATRFGCSPKHIDELAMGNLLTEGIIAGAGEVSSLRIAPDLSRIEAQVASPRKLPLSPVVPVPWKPEAVFRIADEFALDKTVHARTRGAHSAFLCDLEGAVLCLREDIGRHNAFDKVIGWALLNGVDLTRCMLYTSGRVPSDMASKAIRAGIPVFISKSVATDQGLALAREFGLTLICEAKPLQFDLMTA